MVHATMQPDIRPPAIHPFGRQARLPVYMLFEDSDS